MSLASWRIADARPIGCKAIQERPVADASHADEALRPHANARNPYPWSVLTLAAGSFGPLLYLLSARSEQGEKQPAANGTPLRS